MHKAFLGLHQTLSLYLYYGLQFSVLIASVSVQTNESLNLVPFLRRFPFCLFGLAQFQCLFLQSYYILFLRKEQLTKKNNNKKDNQTKDEKNHITTSVNILWSYSDSSNMTQALKKMDKSLKNQK